MATSHALLNKKNGDIIYLEDGQTLKAKAAKGAEYDIIDLGTLETYPFAQLDNKGGNLQITIPQTGAKLLLTGYGDSGATISKVATQIPTQTMPPETVPLESFFYPVEGIQANQGSYYQPQASSPYSNGAMMASQGRYSDIQGIEAMMAPYEASAKGASMWSNVNAIAGPLVGLGVFAYTFYAGKDKDEKKDSGKPQDFVIQPDGKNPGMVINPGGDKPNTGNPGGDKPNTGNPGGDKPNTGNPGGDKPNTGNPGGDKPNTGNPGGDKPNTDNPGGDKPNTGNPGGDKPNTGNPGGDKPNTDNPGGDKPNTGNPGGDKPNTDNPGGDKPDAGNPGGDKPNTGNPGGDKPNTDNPGGDKPNTDNPNTGNPSGDKPNTNIPDGGKDADGDNKLPSYREATVDDGAPKADHAFLDGHEIATPADGRIALADESAVGNHHEGHVFTASSGANLAIQGGDGSDTVQIAGDLYNSKVNLGEGDDRIAVGHLMGGQIEGGKGDDTLALTDGGNALWLSLVSGFETIDLGGAKDGEDSANILRIDAEGLAKNANANGEIRIEGGKGNFVSLDGGKLGEAVEVAGADGGKDVEISYETNAGSFTIIMDQNLYDGGNGII